MRSITFGPTTHFGDNEIRQPEEEEGADAQAQQLLVPMERIPSNSSQHRLINEVIFYAGETLYRESMFGHKELAIKKYCKCKFTFDSSRTYQSYCFEFCGLLNVQIKELKFFIGNKEVSLQRQVRKPCEIEVLHYVDLTKPNSSSLKPAFNELLENGLFSDIDLVINGQTIKAHKCILIARSDKFRAMLNSNLRESIENRVEINNQATDYLIYKRMIQWIYEGEFDAPDSITELLQLLSLTDEYLLHDLQNVCEDQIIENLDGSGALEILTNKELIFPASSENRLKEVSKTVLLDEYERVEEIYPDIEERIAKVKGLMSELFIHRKKIKDKRKKRRVSLGGDDAHKKKVRFNISNTIYEEASAIHDESDSMIEPLSIYSNNSPPGEINDEIIVGSTHSSIHGE